MRGFLLLVVSCLALHNGRGAPGTAVYKFVRCNPNGGESNCVTQKTPEMAWSPDLKTKLPASAAEYLEAEPVEDESPAWKEEEEKEEDDSPLWEEEEEEEEEDGMFEEGDTAMVVEEGESPVTSLSEEGSAAYEGSAGLYMADREMPADTGSGESLTEKDILYRVGDLRGLKRLFPSRQLVPGGKFEEKELKEDHLLQL